MITWPSCTEFGVWGPSPRPFRFAPNFGSGSRGVLHPPIANGAADGASWILSHTWGAPRPPSHRSRPPPAPRSAVPIPNFVWAPGAAHLCTAHTKIGLGDGTSPPPLGAAFPRGGSDGGEGVQGALSPARVPLTVPLPRTDAVYAPGAGLRGFSLGRLPREMARPAAEIRPPVAPVPGIRRGPPPEDE